jgi:hypothetical protein
MRRHWGKLKERPEPTNKYDRFAVQVTIRDGRQIGYVPRTESQEVSECIRNGKLYTGRVKKILWGARVPIPVIILSFYEQKQIDYIADLNPDNYACATISERSVAVNSKNLRVFVPKKPWWKFW